MTRHAIAWLAALAIGGLGLTPQALAISHGCTPPNGVDDVVINVSLGGRTSSASGGFCAAIKQAETLIAQSRVSDDQKKAAYATLASLQSLVATQGRNAAGKKVSGSVGCQGTVNTGQSGTSATGTCGFTINF